MHKKAMIFSAVFFLALSARGLTSAALADQPPADAAPVDETLAIETTAIETTPDETAAVERATNQFYASLNALLAGDASGMEQVWSHADDITYMGPIGGIETGWGQVRAMWDVQADMKLGGHVDATDLHVTVGNDLALVEGYELGSNQDAEGRSIPFRIRATSSFRKENGQWKMIGHHTDLLDSLNNGTDKGAEVRPSADASKQPNATADDDSIDVSEDEVILKLEN